MCVFMKKANSFKVLNKKITYCVVIIYITLLIMESVKSREHIIYNKCIKYSISVLPDFFNNHDILY